MCQQGALIQWTFGSCFRQTRGRILFLELCSGFLALNSHLSLNDLTLMTPTELLILIGVNNPTNAQAKECAGVLRELLGESKRINGYNKWYVPVHTYPLF